ncbi:VOC family protein [Paraburkholderia guartelaensis]|uniref:VOC family protein n=1 Tax=Paraburkholderia guartelaensis TaxID=2546446 RepID=UPI002AB7E956|nr:VOC family protein [Paraburkholderia guartelaensis]
MITVEDIAFVRYQVTDLERMQQFLADFGLHQAARSDSALYMRAAGAVHHTHISERGDVNRPVGFGFLARARADLEQLAAHLGVAVEDNPEPGGGLRVRFTDPAGFVVDVLHGQAAHTPLPTREPLAANPASRRQRFGQKVRAARAPSSVMRLGHVAVLVPNFHETLAFYRDVLGFRVSDTYWAGVEQNTIAAFLHCGLGDQWTDHHTIALVATQESAARFDHTAFEVLDLDDVCQGGEHLKACGYTRSWGIGRHVQGSQIFDYWRDPFGNKIEHWTDGDLVNDGSPVGHAEISNDELSQWAPPLSPEFFA